MPPPAPRPLASGRPHTLAVLLGVALVAGCTVGPDYEAPQTEAPSTWHVQLAQGLAQGEADLQTWWTSFDDALLTSLIERAREGNLDLRLALARVQEARARRGVARGSWFPSIFGTGNYARSQLSEEVFGDSLPQSGSTNNFYSLGVDASWEIDVFGRVRRSVESTTAGYEASVENYRDTLVVLFADVGINYVEARALQARIQSAEGNVRTQQGSLQLTMDRNRAGLVGLLDVRQAELNLATTQAFIPLLRSALAAVINRLGVLMGQTPSALHAEMAGLQPIPSVPDEVLVSLPAELARQRPDIRASERALAAQTAQIGVATADLYPRFALMGSFSIDSLKAARFFTGDATAFSFGPAMSWNLFDGGRVRSNIHVQDALTEQALVSYEQTVLQGLEEVEDSLVAYVEEVERRNALRRSVTAARGSVELVNDLYRAGLTNFQNVLDSERSQFRREDELWSSEGQVADNLIQIYRSLGGGWAPTP